MYKRRFLKEKMDKYEIPLSDRQFRNIIQDCESLPEDEQINFLNERMEEVQKDEGFPSEERIHLLKKYLNEIEIKKRIFASREISNKNQESISSDSDINSTVQKIRWMADDLYLIALFELLCCSKYLHPKMYKRIPSMIRDHFLDKNNDPFNNENIKAQKYKLLHDENKIDEITHEIRDSLREASKNLVDNANA